MRGPMQQPTKFAVRSERDAALHRQDELQAALLEANARAFRDRIHAETAEAKVSGLRRKVESFHLGILLGIPAAFGVGYVAGSVL